MCKYLQIIKGHVENNYAHYCNDIVYLHACQTGQNKQSQKLIETDQTITKFYYKILTN